MTQEILFTSAPQGLAPGSKGFCTVVSTDGMSHNLSERLEMLSGYRHAFTPGDRRAPVNYRHLKTTVSGLEYSVLSRICDAGLDYSQRSNKLAHHIAFEPSDLTAAGPAAILASPGFFIPRWDGQVRTMATGRTPHVPAGRPAVCQHWQSLTGDAGWAGVLAHAASVARPRPVSVIFPQGCDTLPLVVEALNLLPPARRWSVTFSTYFTKAIAGSDILWRFVLDGTKQAELLRNTPHATVIDLSSALGAPPETSYSNAARTGTPNADYNDRFTVLPGRVGEAPPRTPMKMRAEKTPQVPTASEQGEGWYGDDFGGGMAMPPMPPRLPKRVPWYQRTATIVIAGTLLILLAALVLYIAFPPEQPSNPVIFEQPVPDSPPAATEEGGVSSDASEPPSDTSVVTESTSAEPPSDSPQPADALTVEEESPASANPFAAFINDLLPTGVVPFYLTDDSAITSLPLVLENPSDCKVDFHTADPEIDGGLHISVDDSTSDEIQRRWTFNLEPPGGGRQTTLGTLTIDGRELIFERVVDAADDRFQRFCYGLLQLSYDEDSARFLLGEPLSGTCTPVGLRKSDDAIESSVALPQFLDESLIEELRFDILHPLMKGFLVSNVRSGDSFVVGFKPSGVVEIDQPPINDTPVQRAEKGILADLTVSFSVAQEEQENALFVCLLQITPAVYLRLLQKSNSVTLGEQILYGDEDLLAEDRRYDWDLESLTRRLSAEHDEGEIRRAVRREYNRHVADAPRLDETALDFWDSVIDGADEYYKARSASKRGNRAEFRKGLEEAVEVVRGYDATLTVLRDLTDRFHEEQLQLRAYTVVDGHVVDILHTGTNDERD